MCAAVWKSSFGASAMQGWRKEMEDSHSVLPSLGGVVVGTAGDTSLALPTPPPGWRAGPAPTPRGMAAADLVQDCRSMSEVSAVLDALEKQPREHWLDEVARQKAMDVYERSLRSIVEGLDAANATYTKAVNKWQEHLLQLSGNMSRNVDKTVHYCNSMCNRCNEKSCNLAI